MTDIDESNLDEQQAADQQETALTPEQVEEIAIRRALFNEDRGTGSYISLATDREVLARALRTACPGKYPVLVSE